MKSARLASIASVAVLLAACGGGGGGDGGNDPNAPPTVTVPPAPTVAATGLSAATRQFPATDALGKARSAVDLLIGVHQAAPSAAALQKLGTLAPGIGTVAPGPSFACAGGGSITFTAPNPDSTYIYANCVIDGLTFNSLAGESDALADTPSAGLYTLNHVETGVTGTNAPTAPILGGSTTCAPAAGPTPAKCVSTYATLKWGYDFAYANGLANGSMQEAGPLGELNLVVRDFGATSGTAFAFFSDAFFVIIRRGANSFDVWVETDNALPVGTGNWIGFGITDPTP